VNLDIVITKNLAVKKGESAAGRGDSYYGTLMLSWRRERWHPN